MAKLKVHNGPDSGAPLRKGRNPGAVLLAGAAGALALALVGFAFAAPLQHEAVTPKTSGAEVTDPLYKEPYVDMDEWRDTPVRHRYVHGGFKNTAARFSIYFPPKEQYQGRFFQHITPVPGSENLAQSGSGEGDKIGFSVASGGYFVESNEGGMSAILPGKDPAIAGYRVNAAVAKYSRVLAAQMYGPHRTYGYAWGGSGGGFRTIG